MHRQVIYLSTLESLHSFVLIHQNSFFLDKLKDNMDFRISMKWFRQFTIVIQPTLGFVILNKLVCIVEKLTLSVAKRL